MQSTAVRSFRLLPHNVRPGIVLAVAVVSLALAGAGCGSKSGADPGVDAGNGKDVSSTTDISTTPETSGQDLAQEVGGSDVPSTTPDGGGSDLGPTPETNPGEVAADVPLQKINILAIGELVYQGQPEIHAPFVMAAKPWLTQFAAENNMTVTFVESTSVLTDAMLANVNLILQLNHKPFGWTATAKTAFEKYLTTGKGGWVGLHHAALYGSAVSPEQWAWFFTFLGGINYKNYIATFASATVKVEDAVHPVMKGVPATFMVAKEEWYQWDKSPRANVHVLATVDEDTYMPNSTIKMGGDHPVVWTNDKVMGKNLYIFMGHDPNLFQNTAWVTLLKNAIMWAGTPR